MRIPPWKKYTGLTAKDSTVSKLFSKSNKMKPKVFLRTLSPHRHRLRRAIP